MRTTKSQQAKSHRLIIRTAVDLMTQHGFEGTTMKQIARDRKSTRLNSSHPRLSRMPSSA